MPFDLVGKSSFIAKLAGISAVSNTVMQRSAMKAGEFIRGEAIEAINSGGRTGSVYKRGSVTHTASGKGEFPATDTGTLVQNILVQPEGRVGATVGSRANAPHGYLLETRESNARPWLAPTVDKNKDKVFDMFGVSIKGMFK